MPRSVLKLLVDAQGAVEALSEFACGKSFEDYRSQRLLRSAVEREFILIAESLRRISHQFPEAAERIEHIRQISAFRNILVHEYEFVDDAETWKITTEYAPLLKEQIDAWIAEIEQP